MTRPIANGRAAIVIGLLTTVLSLAACGGDNRSPKAEPEGAAPAIGFLSASASTDSVKALRDGLAEAGYRDGATMRLDVQITDDEAELPAIAAEFVADGVDLIIAGGTRAIEAAKAATRTIPIVMTNSGDPVRTGLVADMAKPGGNVTGLTQSSPELAPKRLELLKEAFPGLSTVCVLFNPDHPTTRLAVDELRSAAPELGMTLLVTPVQEENQIEPALRNLDSRGAAAVVVLRDPFTIRTAKQIVAAAETVRLPAMYETANFIDDGGLMLYGPDLADLYYRAAGYVDKILRGARPGDLPIGRPTKFELVVSTAAAARLGTSIAESVHVRAELVD